MAWIATTLIAQPLFLFWKLRAEAARVITLYERLDLVAAEVDGDRVKTRRLAYEACGSQLVAFDATYGPIIRPALRRLRLNPFLAGEALIAASASSEGTAPARDARNCVVNMLRLPTHL